MKQVMIALLMAAALAGCDRAATVASRNLSQAADNFELNRRIVFYNGITNAYMLVIEGRCSFNADTARKVDVTCKVGDNQYKKHSLGLSDNVTYFSEQLDYAQVSEFHYRVVFRPQTILSDIDFQGSAEALKELAPK